MKNDQELGLYDEPFDNPLVKEPSVTPQNEEEMMLTTNSDIIESIPMDDEVSDWDETLMDGLEEENNFQEEPTEEEESENFSTIEPNLENILQDEEYLTEAIREFNQQSFDDGEWTPELEEQFWKEQPPQPFATPEELNLDLQILNDTLNEVNGEIDNNTSNEDEKKN